MRWRRDIDIDQRGFRAISADAEGAARIYMQRTREKIEIAALTRPPL